MTLYRGNINIDINVHIIACASLKNFITSTHALKYKSPILVLIDWLYPNPAPSSYPILDVIAKLQIFELFNVNIFPIPIWRSFHAFWTSVRYVEIVHNCVLEVYGVSGVMFGRWEGCIRSKNLKNEILLAMSAPASWAGHSPISLFTNLQPYLLLIDWLQPYDYGRYCFQVRFLIHDYNIGKL